MVFTGCVSVRTLWGLLFSLSSFTLLIPCLFTGGEYSPTPPVVHATDFIDVRLNLWPLKQQKRSGSKFISIWKWYFVVLFAWLQLEKKKEKKVLKFHLLQNYDLIKDSNFVVNKKLVKNYGPESSFCKQTGWFVHLKEAWSIYTCYTTSLNDTRGSKKRILKENLHVVLWEWYSLISTLQVFRKAYS